MDITIYLPDELGRRAKDRGVNMSRMLRDALTAQFQEEHNMATMLERASEITLKLENDNGNVYIGRFTGRKLAEGDHVAVYLTDQHRVVVHDVDNLRYVTEDAESDLEKLIGDQAVYLEVMDALGREATVDLDI